MSIEIDDELVDASFVEEEVRQFKLSCQQRRMALPPKEDLYRYVRENIVRKILLYREAERRKIPCSEQEIEQTLANYKGGKEFDPKQLRDYARSTVMVDKMLDAVGRDHHPIQQRHLDQFYIENLDYYDKKTLCFVDEVTFFNVESQEKNEQLRKEAQLFYENFLQWVKCLEEKLFLSQDDSLQKIRDKIRKDLQKFANKDFSVEHRALGWLDDDFLAGAFNSLCIFGSQSQPWVVSSFVAFAKGFLFYIKTKTTLGKNLSKEDLSLILQRDLQREIQENNVELFIQKLLQKAKVVYYEDF